MESRLACALGPALLAMGCASEPARSAQPTVLVPAASVEPSTDPEAPPRSGAPTPEPRRGPSSPDELARAETLFAEGRSLMQQGKYAEACERFALSMQLDAAVGTLLNLASCMERTGDTKRACIHFAQARDLAHEKGQTERERFAEARLGALGCP